jgi:uncharacterized integral membrane protein
LPQYHLPIPRKLAINQMSKILSLTLLVVMVVFGIQNLESTDLQFLVFSLRMPKILLILLVFALGMVSGWGLLDLLKGAIRNVSAPSSSTGKPN